MRRLIGPEYRSVRVTTGICAATCLLCNRSTRIRGSLRRRIHSLVDTGECSDPRAADWIGELLIERRDKIAEAWFTKVLPLDNLRISYGIARVRGSGNRTRARKGPQLRGGLGELQHKHRAEALPNAIAKVPAFRASKDLAATLRCTSADVVFGNPVAVYVRQGVSGLEVADINR